MTSSIGHSKHSVQQAELYQTASNPMESLNSCLGAERSFRLSEQEICVSDESRGTGESYGVCGKGDDGVRADGGDGEVGDRMHPGRSQPRQIHDVEPVLPAGDGICTPVRAVDEDVIAEPTVEAVVPQSSGDGVITTIAADGVI